MIKPSMRTNMSPSDSSDSAANERPTLISTPLRPGRRRSTKDPYALSVAAIAIRELRAENYDLDDDENSDDVGCSRDGEKDADGNSSTKDNEEEGGTGPASGRGSVWRSMGRPVGGDLQDSLNGDTSFSSVDTTQGSTQAVPEKANKKGPARMKGRGRHGTPSDIFGWEGNLLQTLVRPDREKDSEDAEEPEKPKTKGPPRMKGRGRHGTPSDIFGWEGNLSLSASSQLSARLDPEKDSEDVEEAEKAKKKGPPRMKGMEDTALPAMFLVGSQIAPSASQDYLSHHPSPCFQQGGTPSSEK